MGMGGDVYWCEKLLRGLIQPCLLAMPSCPDVWQWPWRAGCLERRASRSSAGCYCLVARPPWMCEVVHHVLCAQEARAHLKEVQ